MCSPHCPVLWLWLIEVVPSQVKMLGFRDISVSLLSSILVTWSQMYCSPFKLTSKYPSTLFSTVLPCGGPDTWPTLCEFPQGSAASHVWQTASPSSCSQGSWTPFSPKLGHIIDSRGSSAEPVQGGGSPSSPTGNKNGKWPCVKLQHEIAHD